MILCHPSSTYAPLAGLHTIFGKQVIVAVSLKDIVGYRLCVSGIVKGSEPSSTVSGIVEDFNTNARSVP